MTLTCGRIDLQVAKSLVGELTCGRNDRKPQVYATGLNDENYNIPSF